MRQNTSKYTKTILIYANRKHYVQQRSALLQHMQLFVVVVNEISSLLKEVRLFRPIKTNWKCHKCYPNAVIDKLRVSQPLRLSQQRNICKHAHPAAAVTSEAAVCSLHQ